jgi:hypothetical protein
MIKVAFGPVAVVSPHRKQSENTFVTFFFCFSDKYDQLGRALTDNADYDPYFRQCTLLFDNKAEKAIDCFAGRWTSFVFTSGIVL